jgi:hypothetical protein
LTEKFAVENAISNLANAMRIYGEAQMRFSGLFRVDPEEAIDNVDRAFEMKLERLHTLYDVSKHAFPYFDNGDTSLLISIRNAIHHRDHPLFQSLNRRLHLEDGVKRWLGASFLLAKHPTTHGGKILMSHFVRLDDIDARIDPLTGSPYLDQSVTGNRAKRRLEVVNAQLGLPRIRDRAVQDRYPSDQVYLDLMPVYVSAVCKIFKAMKAAGVEFKGFDAKAYATPFTTELAVDLSEMEFKRLWLRGYGVLDLVPFPV